MMLFKLSIKNISKSMKDYAIYFFTLILGVSIFYVFNAIESQTIMMNVSSATYEIIKLMTNMLSGVSVFVSFVLAFLIIYASRFLIKRRNKEFGIYLTLGMSKRKISLILFFETLFIGIISLVVGLGLGFLLSQLMSILVANMFEADMTNFKFVFSTDACVKTLIYFSIMYLVVMIFNTFNVSRCKLIDLLYASKKSEKVKLKNPLLCVIVFIVSSCALGYAYYLVTDGVKVLQNASSIYLPIVLGAVSTFLIFWSLSGLILKIVRSSKRFYYHGLNSFTIRQISSKINTTVFSMTVICLMLFSTICILSSALSMKNSLTANLKGLVPADIQFSQKIENGDEEHIEETLKKADFDVDSNFKDTVEFYVYTCDNVTLENTLGEYISQIKSNYPFLMTDTKEEIVKLSDYNKVAQMYGLEKQSLKNDEYIIVANYKDFINIRNGGLKAGAKITINGIEYRPKFDKCVDGFIEMNGSYANSGFFVVPDSAAETCVKSKEIMIANYRADSKEERKEIDQKVIDLDKVDYILNSTIEARTKLYVHEASIGLGTMVTFIGLYLGIIFLISCAAILALKELSESSDNAEKFQMLRKLGVDEKMINKALFRQIGVFFMFPLVLAIIHSIFGIKFCNFLLTSIGTDNLLSSIIMTAVFIVAIYGGYFVVTYLCSKNVIKEKLNN